MSAQGSAPSEYLELYKIAVEMADRISARRGTANSFFLTIHAGLVAFLGWASPRSSDDIGLALTAAAGLVLAGTWWLLLLSYRRLNEAKYSVIHELELNLQTSPFKDEWDRLKSRSQGDRKGPLQSWRGRYAELGFAERIVPLAFGVIYLVSIIRSLA